MVCPGEDVESCHPDGMLWSKKEPLFCPKNSLMRVSFPAPCDVLERSSPQTPFTMLWLNSNCKEGVLIIASVMSFMTNITYELRSCGVSAHPGTMLPSDSSDIHKTYH